MKDTMLLTFSAQIRQYSDTLFIGWIDKIKGLVVEASSKEEVKQELLISLKVKIAYDYGFEISKIDHKVAETEEEINELLKKEKEQSCLEENTLQLTLA